MSFKTWYNSNKAGWESIDNIQVSVTTRSNGYSTNNGFPLDYRTLRQTYAQALQLGSGYRYPGLKVYVLNEDTEYVFKLTDTTTLAMADGDTLKEYHPELAHVKTERPVKTYDANNEPSEYYSDGEILANPTIALGDGHFDITKNNNTITYYTIPEGAEGTYKTSDGKYYKFVWNGSEWVTYANTGSGSQSTPAVESIVNFTISDHVDPSDNTSALMTSINDVTSDAISAKYGTPTPGAETNVVFTETIDNQDYQTCRRYVYLNDGWNITRGTQEFTVTFPAYAANEGTWETWEPDSLTWPAGIEISKGDTEGFVNVYVTHQFDTKFVDAFVFTTGSADIDGDDSADEYGNRVLASATCFKSAQTGAYKVKLVLPIHANNETAYAITLQK